MNEFPKDTEGAYILITDRARPITIDWDILGLAQYKNALEETNAVHIIPKTRNHEMRVITEWFYALFFAYKESNMDESLQSIIKYILIAYPNVVAKNKQLLDFFTKLKQSDDILTKQIFALIVISREPDVQRQIVNITEKSVNDPELIKKGIQSNYNVTSMKVRIDIKMQRLIQWLPGEANEYVRLLHHRFNAVKNEETFLKRAISMYEHGLT